MKPFRRRKKGTLEDLEKRVIKGGEALPPITLFTFFLELPFPVPVPEGMSTVTVGNQRDEHWDGWSDKAIARILTREKEQAFPSGLAPGTRFVVRHVEVTDRVPLYVAEEAFSDWVDELFPDDLAAERKEKRDEWSLLGLDVMKSVVALSRFVPRSAHPRGEDITVAWVLSQFRAALADFNEFLEALGLVLGRWNVGAIGLRDLPPEVPVLIGSTHLGPHGRPHGITFTARIHDAYPLVVENFEPKHGPVDEAVNLSNLARHGEQPYMLVFRFLHSAVSERLAGDATRAVIDLNTAVEIFVSVTVNEGGPLVGLTSEEIAKANRPGFKRRVQVYLAKVLDEEIEVDDSTTTWGRWFADGYNRRNEAVHEGAALEWEEVERAFDQANAVIAEVKAKLAQIEALEELSSKIALDLSNRNRSFQEQPLGVAFPWD